MCCLMFDDCVISYASAYICHRLFLLLFRMCFDSEMQCSFRRCVKKYTWATYAFPNINIYALNYFVFFIHVVFIKQCVIRLAMPPQRWKLQNKCQREMTICWVFSRAAEHAGDRNEIFFETGVTQNLVWKCTQPQLITGEKQKCGEGEKAACSCHRFHHPQRHTDLFRRMDESRCMAHTSRAIDERESQELMQKLCK